MFNLRKHFLLDPSVIFLNHGSFGATPKPVFNEYQRWQRELENQPVEFLGRRFTGLMAESRAVLGEYLGTHADNLVYTQNVTISMNIVARSLELGAGDEVLSSDHEYGAMDRTWRFLAKENGFTYINQPISLASKEAFIDSFWSGVTAHTRVIFISHITSPTALIFPVEEIIKRARAAGIITIIDGAHVPGQIPLHLDSLGADFYGGNLHNWQVAEKCFRESLKFLEANGDKRLISKAITHTGDALKKQGRWNEALGFFEQALEIDRALGDSDAETIDLQDIASIYEEQGRFSEALDLYRKCVQILGDSTDRDRGAKLLSNAASCMSMMGRMDDAIPLLELALKLRTDPQSVGYATTLTTLGSVLRRQGKLEEADKAFTQALSIISDLKDFYLKSVLVNHFGTLLYEKGQFEEAKQNYQTALEMKQQLGDLKGVGVVLNNLGMLFEKMSLLDDAVAALSKSLKIRQQLGDVRGVAVNSNNLGNVYFGLGQHQTALEKYLESIQLCRESGILDVQIISLKRIAILYRTKGDIENAAAAEVEVLRRV